MFYTALGHVPGQNRPICHRPIDPSEGHYREQEVEGVNGPRAPGKCI